MKKTLLVLIVLSLVFVRHLWAKIVPVDLAKTVAKNVFYERVNLTKAMAYDDIRLKYIKTYTDDTQESLMYLFSDAKQAGFVLISADDLVEPVLAYSFESDFDENIPAVEYMLEIYKKQIKYAKEKRLTASDEIKQKWAKYLFGTDVSLKNKSIKAGEPLLRVMWDQGTYYNTSCPADASGSDGHVVVGCVAVSMGQAMKYYNYPAYGTGSKKSYDSQNGGYGNFSVNFNRRYKWRNMPFSATVYNKDLADLLFHLGVAVRMRWGPDGSSSSSGFIVGALKNYFYYSDSVKEIYRNDYSDSEWVAIIKNEVDNHRPMVYSGSGSGGGHAWNCDGYQGDKVHMNWGWGGSSNGYYSIDNLVAGGYDFNDYQSLIINIEPKNNYPSWCIDVNDTIDGTEGSFDDGSGYYNYKNNKTCEYLLAPSCASHISLSFDEFNLDTNDLLIIYDGNSDTAPVLDTLSGANPPAGKVFEATLDTMFLKFITNDSIVDDGWIATYTTSKCKGTRTITDTSGVLTDGSKKCDYNNNSYCIWNIKPTNHPYAILLTFTEWDMPENDTKDFVKIYKQRISTANTLAKYTGADSPKAILVEDSVAVIRFYSNREITGGGWKIEYTTVGVGFNLNKSFINKVSASPNPFNNDANINITLSKSTEITIQVYNVLGIKLGDFTTSLMQGENTLQLSDITKTMNDKIYFVQISDGTSVKVLKLMKL